MSQGNVHYEIGANHVGDRFILVLHVEKLLVIQGLVKGAKICLNPYFFGWLEKYSLHVKNKSHDFCNKITLLLQNLELIPVLVKGCQNLG